MTAALRAEFLKLRTTRLVAGMTGLAVALTGLIGVLEAVTAGTGKGMAIPSLGTADGLRDNLASTGFALLVAALLGVVITSGEFRLKTATDTYLDQPDRARVMAAKTIAAAAAGAVFGAVAAGIATGAGLMSASGKGYHISLAAGDFTRYAAGAVLGAALLAGIGAVVGSLVSSQIAAIVTVFVWCLAIEQIVAGVSTSAARFLPLIGAMTMAGADSRAGMPPLPNGIHPLPAAAMTGILAALLVILSAVTVHRLNRDIT
jgi:ABC-type transport system involved in multi-copper enzyme maturation permease subunit